MRQQLVRLISHRLFEPVIMVLIVVNAVTLALETSPGAMAAAGPLLIALDRAILAVFVLKCLPLLHLCNLVAHPGHWD